MNTLKLSVVMAALAMALGACGAPAEGDDEHGSAEGAARSARSCEDKLAQREAFRRKQDGIGAAFDMDDASTKQPIAYDALPAPRQIDEQIARYHKGDYRNLKAFKWSPGQKAKKKKSGLDNAYAVVTFENATKSKFTLIATWASGTLAQTGTQNFDDQPVEWTTPVAMDWSNCN